MRIIRNHGVNRILFATDSPWDGQKESLDAIRSLDFSEQELSLILGQNAAQLLGLPQ